MTVKINSAFHELSASELYLAQSRWSQGLVAMGAAINAGLFTIIIVQSSMKSAGWLVPNWHTSKKALAPDQLPGGNTEGLKMPPGKMSLFASALEPCGII